jgi:hypothetical protein
MLKSIFILASLLFACDQNEVNRPTAKAERVKDAGGAPVEGDSTADQNEDTASGNSDGSGINNGESANLPPALTGPLCIGHKCKNMVRDKAAVDAESPLLVGVDFATINAAIAAAKDGNIVLVKRGTYNENVVLNKNITLASMFYVTGDEADITGTIIAGGQEGTIQVPAGTAGKPAIIGFTIQANQAPKAVICASDFAFFNNIVSGNSDGLSFEDTAGTARWNTLRGNSDDGVDIDGYSAAVVEFNVIETNGQDGIEQRMQPFTGKSAIEIFVRHNIIRNNAEDGYQIIDYNGKHERTIYVGFNLTVGNGFAGIGFMQNATTNAGEYTTAPAEETVYIYNNTMTLNKYGIRGGGQVFFLNNLVTSNSVLGAYDVKKVGTPLGRTNLFFGNVANHDIVTFLEDSANFYEDPKVSPDSFLALPGSITVDAGSTGIDKLVIPSESYSGKAPDIGAGESISFWLK